MAGLRFPRTTRSLLAQPPRQVQTERAGFALLTVLMVLLSLLVLCAPFLLTARNVSKSSNELADRIQARLALDAAGRHARATLGRSHPALDETPHFDSAAELSVTNELDDEFYDANDPTGAMWDLEVHDLAGRIDLNSASPHVFANLLDLATRLSKTVAQADGELSTSSRASFPEQGFLWISGELILYSKTDGSKFVDVTRGFLCPPQEERDEPVCGPQCATDHPAGAIVLEQKAFAPALWRLHTADGTLRTYDSIDRLAEASEHALSGALTADEVDHVSRFATTWSHIRGARRWQRAARLVDAVEGGRDCRIRVDNGRWINVGATVQITDGQTTELGVVERVEDNQFFLDHALVNDYDAFAAEVRVLARRPVNVNSATPEVLEVLFKNLKLRGRNSRITGREARELAGLIVQGRPFTSFEDFLTRLVLPAAGIEDASETEDTVSDDDAPAVIDPYDAEALYRNALNANDANLEFSTMPLTFCSSDTFELELRASVNAPSGVERTSAVRQQIESIVPQQELLQLWASQADFDEAFRIDREAPYWASGPSATSRFDENAQPPSRFQPHFGTLNGLAYNPAAVSTVAEDNPNADEIQNPERVFGDPDPDVSWAQLMPARVIGAGNRQGRVRHFIHESRSLEGRFLPDEPLVLDPSSRTVDWIDDNSMVKPFSFQLWFKPDLLADGNADGVGRERDRFGSCVVAARGRRLGLPDRRRRWRSSAVRLRSRRSALCDRAERRGRHRGRNLDARRGDRARYAPESDFDAGRRTGSRRAGAGLHALGATVDARLDRDRRRG